MWILHLDVFRHRHPQEEQREHLEGLEGEGEPGAGDVGVADVPHAVHGQAQDEQVDNTDLRDQVVGEI